MFSANYLEPLLNNLQKQAENHILEQLNELVKRGLLVIKATKPVLVRDEKSANMTLQQSVTLELKDQEYIEELEHKVALLQSKVDSFLYTSKRLNETLEDTYHESFGEEE